MLTTRHPMGLRILGVDPGLNTTGYGVIEVAPAGPIVCEAGVIRSTEGRERADMAPRLLVLYNGIDDVIVQYRPVVMAVEQLFAHYEHPRTAILMAHARGVIMLAAAKYGLPVFSYSAKTVKKTITGSGSAGKEQMQHAMLRELGMAVLPEPHDVADALAAALCHYYAQHIPTDEAG
jgi:crossover junction endodeoxyribonuclease RuvC